LGADFGVSTPPYIASVVLVLIVVFGRKIVTGTNDFIAIPHGVAGWLATVTLTTSPVSTVPAIKWVYWSLSYETAFYLLLSLTLVFPSLKWAILLVTTILAVCWPSSPIFFLEGWAYFALGAALAELNIRFDWRPLFLIGWCLIDLGLNRQLSQCLTAVATAVLIMACTNVWGTWLNSEPLFSRVGTCSYSLYLTHVPIGCWLLLRIDPYPRLASASSLTWHISLDFSVLAICVAVAHAFWRWLEEPSTRKFKPRLVSLAKRNWLT